MKAAALIAVLAAALLAAIATPVAAQYPTPIGSCTVGAGTGSAPPNTTITFTVTVLQADGTTPAAGVSGTASIISQPGQGASILNPNYTTGSDGKASIQVQTGNTAGQITIGVTCGSLSANGLISVVAGATPRPPVTGAGVAGPGGSDYTALWFILPLAGLAAAGAAAVALRRR